MQGARTGTAWEACPHGPLGIIRTVQTSCLSRVAASLVAARAARHKAPQTNPPPSPGTHPRQLRGSGRAAAAAACLAQGTKAGPGIGLGPGRTGGRTVIKSPIGGRACVHGVAARGRLRRRRPGWAVARARAGSSHSGRVAMWGRDAVP